MGGATAPTQRHIAHRLADPLRRAEAVFRSTCSGRSILGSGSVCSCRVWYQTTVRSRCGAASLSGRVERASWSAGVAVGTEYAEKHENGMHRPAGLTA